MFAAGIGEATHLPSGADLPPNTGVVLTHTFRAASGLALAYRMLVVPTRPISADGFSSLSQE
jgi:hypothetical protein